METNYRINNLNNKAIDNIYKFPNSDLKSANKLINISLSHTISNNFASDYNTFAMPSSSNSIDEDTNIQSSNIKWNRNIKIARPPKVIIPFKKPCAIVTLTTPQNIDSISINSFDYLSKCPAQINNEKIIKSNQKQLPCTYKSSASTQESFSNSLQKIRNQIISLDQRKSEKVCRICFEHETKDKGGIISVCNCPGNLKYMHAICLKKSIADNQASHEEYVCQFCNKKYNLRHIGLKWRLNWKNILLSVFLSILLYVLTSLLVLTLQNL